ncbi:hypothetical protein JZ751_016826 [Albula glossodonta]|uniref:Uncharacterized protein n=1 Tax=Albula glossodonta TaxID=121402 RepID=A0A8T2NQF3_9TELE|nr:hypothetical protein JZ751_016826 [Albula glossodonta]
MTSDLLPFTGEAYMRLNKLTEAEHWYRESLRAKPDHIPAHLTYGKLLAIRYPAALMNLGAILHLNGKLREAESNYLRALQLKPQDVITQSNLRKLWNIMEKQGMRTASP